MRQNSSSLRAELYHGIMVHQFNNSTIGSSWSYREDDPSKAGGLFGCTNINTNVSNTTAQIQMQLQIQIQTQIYIYIQSYMNICKYMKTMKNYGHNQNQSKIKKAEMDLQKQVAHV